MFFLVFCFLNFINICFCDDVKIKSHSVVKCTSFSKVYYHAARDSDGNRILRPIPDKVTAMYFLFDNTTTVPVIDCAGVKLGAPIVMNGQRLRCIHDPSSLFEFHRDVLYYIGVISDNKNYSQHKFAHPVFRRTYYSKTLSKLSYSRGEGEIKQIRPKQQRNNLRRLKSEEDIANPIPWEKIFSKWKHHHLTMIDCFEFQLVYNQSHSAKVVDIPEALKSQRQMVKNRNHPRQGNKIKPQWWYDDDGGDDWFGFGDDGGGDDWFGFGDDGGGDDWFGFGDDGGGDDWWGWNDDGGGDDWWGWNDDGGDDDWWGSWFGDDGGGDDWLGWFEGDDYSNDDDWFSWIFSNDDAYSSENDDLFGWLVDGSDDDWFSFLGDDIVGESVGEFIQSMAFGVATMALFPQITVTSIVFDAAASIVLGPILDEICPKCSPYVEAYETITDFFSILPMKKARKGVNLEAEAPEFNLVSFTLRLPVELEGSVVSVLVTERFQEAITSGEYELALQKASALHEAGIDDIKVRDVFATSPYIVLQQSEPTVAPSAAPTLKPTFKPTTVPTLKPTFKPTLKPTVKRTFKPTLIPTFKPTTDPTLKPTFKPTLKPTLKPNVKTSKSPSQAPSKKPRKAIKLSKK